MTRAVLALFLLPATACNLDFDHGASRNPGGDGGNATHPVYGTLVDIPVPPGTRSARLVDIDGDGAPDLVSLGSAGFLIQQGDGHGKFAWPVAGPALADADELAFGDYDGDGHVDLVTAAIAQVTLWHNDGSGGLSAAASYTSSPPVAGLLLGAFDGSTGGMQLVQATGDGYEADQVLATHAGAEVDGIGGGVGGEGIAVNRGRLNAAGDPVAVVTQRVGTTSTITILQMPGVASSTKITGDALGLGARALLSAGTVADVTGDGGFDTIIACASPAGVATTSAGHGTHLTATGAVPELDYLDTGDFDGDGVADVIAAGLYGQKIVVLSGGTGAAAGQLAVDATFETPSEILALHVDGDVDGDGIPDPVITLTDRIEILMSAAGAE